jgi:hypothetical protein
MKRKPQTPLAALRTVRKLISHMEIRYIMVDGEQTFDQWLQSCIATAHRKSRPNYWAKK